MLWSALLTIGTQSVGCSTLPAACAHPPPPPLPVRLQPRPDWSQVEEWAAREQWAPILVELDRAWRYEERLEAEWPR